MTRSDAAIHVAIVRYKPDVEIDMPMSIMMGPATITLEAARKLRDALDIAIKKFDEVEGDTP
jgi:hypothetical protein